MAGRANFPHRKQQRRDAAEQREQWYATAEGQAARTEREKQHEGRGRKR